MGPIAGMVLGHDVQVRLRRDLLGEEPHHLGGPCQPLGEDQVADEKTPDGDPVLVDLQRPHLPVHL